MSSATPPPFKPATGLRNPHVQTLWGPLWRKSPPLAHRRERLWLADGDFLDLDWHGPLATTTPLVVVLHGLTGSSTSHYVIGLQRALAAQGWASVAVNWRGCSGEPNLLPRSYHSGASEDLAEVIAHLRTQRPQAPLYAVGYSLGGNVLLKHLGKRVRPASCRRPWRCRCRFAWTSAPIASAWGFHGCTRRTSCAPCWAT